MFTQPRDLDTGEIADVLEARWGLRELTLDYLPVGFGSHHWLATHANGARHFVSVDDLEAGFQAGPDAAAAFAALDRAFRTASALGNAGLEFVVAQLPDDTGAFLRRLDDRYAIRVAPFVDGDAGAVGEYETEDERREMATLLGRLHGASEAVPAGLPRQEDFALPSGAELEKALGDLDTPWHSGPFGEPTRSLLRRNAADVARRLQEYDALVARVRAGSEPWVVTHGEPHRANVVRVPTGGLHLVDWDTTLLAPRERDLRMVLNDEGVGWEEYTAEAGRVSLRPEAIELYRAWWDLAEISIYVAQFRAAHDETEDTRVAWESLNEYV